MSRFITLPADLKSWKVVSKISSDTKCDLYKIIKKNYDGTVVNGLLRHLQITGEDYNGESIGYFQDEVAFLNSISRLGDGFNYVEVVADNEPSKERYNLYIISEDICTLSQLLKTKSFSESDIIDFGIQMSSLIEKLEANNIFHGNIKPDNIYVTDDGKYKLGNFLDCESCIDNFSFVAPEIYKNEAPDCTTDIYSVGMIMYIMSNNNKFPFESDDITEEEAIKERLSGKSISAPLNGNEKLKSVIVIACQPDKTNRWKNAGNIKNALSSININDKKKNPDVIPVASTEFSDNVFEDFDYIENDVSPIQGQAEKASDDAGFEIINVADNEENHSDESPKVISFVKKDNTEQLSKAEALDTASDDIFDSVEVKNPKTNKRFNSVNNDYGKYFDEEENEKATENNIKKENDGFTEFDSEPKKKHNGKKAIIIICIIVILFAVGVGAYFVLNSNNIFANNDKKNNNQATTAAVSIPTTEQITTEPMSTGESKAVMSVIGYGYYYGKQLLEDDGFVVEIEEFKYSNEYAADLIISQTPEGNTSAEVGSVIKIVVSKGPDNSTANDSEYILPNADSTYLSAEQISALSDYELQMAINEMYARRGRIYTDETLNSYFSSKSWYVGKYTIDEFDSYVTFNEYEEYNINLLINERASR